MKVTDIVEAVDIEQRALEKAATEVADKYWAWVYAENKKREGTRDGFAAIGVRVRLHLDNVRIEWHRLGWKKMKDDSYERRDAYIKKGRGYKYTEATLRKHAKGWEVEKALEAEEVFAEIRRKAETLGKIRYQTKRYQRY